MLETFCGVIGGEGGLLFGAAVNALNTLVCCSYALLLSSDFKKILRCLIALARPIRSVLDLSTALHQYSSIFVLLLDKLRLAREEDCSDVC